MALNIKVKSGKGKRSQDVIDAYKAIEVSGQEVSFLAPGSYTDTDLIREIGNGKVYRPFCKSLGMV